MSLDTAKATVVLRSLTKIFDDTVRAATPYYPELCTIAPSDGADEQYGWLGSMPGMREWLGERQFNELSAANFVLANKHWESSLLISKNNLKDDRHGMYRLALPALAAEATYHPDEELFTTIVDGESKACFDGQFFFDTDHSWGDSGSQSNDLTYNAADPNAVTSTEFKAAFHAARLKMVEYKNDQNKLLNRPVIKGMTKLMVLVPPELKEPAVTAFESLVISNSTNIVLDKPMIVESAHLTDATKFYLFNLAGILKPFVFQAREPLSRGMKGLDDIETKDVKFMTEARYSLGYLAWWTAVLTTFN